MKKFHLSLFAIVAILFLAIFSTGCSKDSDNNAVNPDVAGLMAFNLAPDKTVSIAIGGNYLTNQPLAFNNYTGGYQQIYPGSRTVESFDYATNSSIASVTDSFEAKKYYSVFVVGAANAYQNVLVNDNFDALSASSGKAYIRYINAINGSVNPAVTITAGGSEVVNNNAAFASVSEFTAVDPGNVTITVNDGAAVNVSRTITTEAKNVYTVLLTSGATSADSAQIRYILNGTLDTETGERISNSARSANSN